MTIMYIGHQYLIRFKRRGNVVVCFLNVNYIMVFFVNFIYFYWAYSLACFQFININIKNDLIVDFKDPRKAHFILTLKFSLASVP